MPGLAEEEEEEEDGGGCGVQRYVNSKLACSDMNVIKQDGNDADLLRAIYRLGQ